MSIHYYLLLHRKHQPIPQAGGSKGIIDTQAEPFLEHKIRKLLVLITVILRAVVYPGIEEELGVQVFVNRESERVFPLHIGHLHVAEPIDAGVPLDVLPDFPTVIDRNVGTEVVVHAPPRIQAEIPIQGFTADRTEVIGHGGQVGGTLETLQLQLVVHT